MKTQTVIILGGSSGIGAGLVSYYLEKGANVFALSRRTEEINEHNPKATAIYFDINEIYQISSGLDEVIKKIDKLDLIINCIGIGDINEKMDNKIDLNTLQTNVLGFTIVSNWCFNYLQSQGYGHYVAITSIAGLRGAKDSLSYNASKAYQINYLEGLQQKAKQSKLPIYITDIRPGLVATQMAKGEGLFWVMPVSKVVKQITKGIRRKKRYQYVTKRWGQVAFVLKRIPGFIHEKM